MTRVGAPGTMGAGSSAAGSRSLLEWKPWAGIGTKGEPTKAPAPVLPCAAGGTPGLPDTGQTTCYAAPGGG
jgi:hypothetical protein